MLLLGIIQDNIYRWAVNWTISAESNSVALNKKGKEETLNLLFRKTWLLRMPLFLFQTSSSKSGYNTAGSSALLALSCFAELLSGLLLPVGW